METEIGTLFQRNLIPKCRRRLIHKDVFSHSASALLQYAKGSSDFIPLDSSSIHGEVFYITNIQQIKHIIGDKQLIGAGSRNKKLLANVGKIADDMAFEDFILKMYAEFVFLELKSNYQKIIDNNMVMKRNMNRNGIRNLKANLDRKATTKSTKIELLFNGKIRLISQVILSIQTNTISLAFEYDTMQMQQDQTIVITAGHNLVTTFPSSSSSGHRHPCGT
eukprot:378658_1